MQRDVSATLRRLGAAVEEEHLCEASGYSIDALVVLGSDRVARRAITAALVLLRSVGGP